MLPQKSYSCIQLSLGNRIGTGKDNGGGCLYLVVVELTKVLHIELHLAGIGNSNSITQLHIMTGHLLHSTDHIGQLADTGGFNDDPVGMILSNDLFQSLAEVTHQAAADTTGIHLRNIDASFLQKAAVNANLTKFVFNQNQFLILITFGDHFLDQSSLTCAKEARVNINFCHKSTFCT